MSEKMTVEEKLSKYEEMINELLQKASMREGKVIGVSPDTGYYKVKTAHEEIIVKSPKIKIKEGDMVITTDNVVTDFLPDNLISVHKEEITDFDKISWNEVGGMKSQIESIKKKIEFPILHKKLLQRISFKISKRNHFIWTNWLW